VGHTCNPSYLGDQNQEAQGSRPTWTNSSWDPISKITREKRTGGAAQVAQLLPCKLEALSSNPQYHQKQNNKKLDTTWLLSEWPKSKTVTPPNADKDMEQQEFLLTASGNVKWPSYFGTVWQFLTKLTIGLSCNPVCHIPSIYLNESKLRSTHKSVWGV
jgi:hypothetical protein